MDMPLGEYEIVGEKIVAMRKRAILTRQEFAEKAGISVGNLRRLEGEVRTTVQMKTFRALAKGFETTPQELEKEICPSDTIRLADHEASGEHPDTRAAKKA